MNFIRLTGPSIICVCATCFKEGVGGSESYTSASTGEERQPEDWYTDGVQIYCGEDAAKLSQSDPSRARSRFYLDTKGTQIDPHI